MAESMKNMIVDANCNKILLEAIAYLDHEDFDKALVKKSIPLLSFFSQEIFDSNQFDGGGDAWLEKLAFGFCMKYFESNAARNKLLHQDCFKLLLLSCKRPFICVKLLKICIGYIDLNKIDPNSKFTNTECGMYVTDDRPGVNISLDLIIQLFREVLSSVDVGMITGVKQDIIVSVIQLLKCEDITDSCFILICGLLKDFVNSNNETEIELIWSTINYLCKKSKYAQLMLLISILVQTITNSYIIKKVSFWIMVQDGLVFEDPLTRKRALYIIKWILDHISKGDSFITTDPDDGSGFIVSWNKNMNEEAWNIWKTVILLLETLNESQIHVINPVLPLINDVYSACVSSKDGHLLHFSWLLVILRRALNHQSKLLNKQALQYCLQMNLEKYLVASNQSLQFVFVDLMKSLQLTHVYTREENSPWGTPPVILGLMRNFICKCLTHLGVKQSQFINRILDVFNASYFQYNEISLVYFTEVLSHQTLSTQLSNVEITKFKQFCFSKVGIYRIEYQKVIFCNLSLFYTENMLSEKSSVSDIMIMLAYAIDNGFLVLNGNCWNMWVAWLNKMSDGCKEEVIVFKIQEIIEENVTSLSYYNDSTNFSIFSLLVILQCLICPVKNRNINLRGLTDTIDKMHSNPYLDTNKILKALELTNILFGNLLKYDSSIVSDVIIGLISRSSNILEHVQKIICDSTQVHENNGYLILEQCLSLLQHYISSSSHKEYGKLIAPNIKNFFSKIYTKIISNLKSILCALEDLHNNQYLLSIFFSIKLVRYYLSRKDVVIEEPDVLFKILVNIIIKYDSRVFNGVCKKSEVFQHINSEYFICELWSSLTFLIENHNHMLINGVDVENKVLLLDNFFCDITIVSYDHILDVVQFGKCFIPMFIDCEDELIHIIDCMWKIVKDQSRTANLFWSLYRSCVECIFHERLLTSNNMNVIKKLQEIWRYILEEGEKKINVVNIFIDHCIEVWNRQGDPCASLTNYIEELIMTSIFGSFLVKSTRPWDDLIYYLHKLSRYDEIVGLKSGHSANENVRVTVLNFLLNLNRGPSASDFFNQLKINLLENAFELGTSRKAYYPNTQVHRKILRIWQLFIVLLGKYSHCFDYKVILPKLYLSVKTAYQTSIRYFIEWCILLILHHDNRLLETLLNEMDQGSEKQILSITSMMSLAVHLTNLLKGDDFEMFVKEAVPKVLPWAHAQHMTSRIHAQIVLQSIWDNILKNGCKSLQCQYSFLSYCFALKVDSSAAVKNRRGLREHFFYSQFCPIENYSLETIFHKLPAHVYILNDEWITVDKFEGAIGLPEDKSFRLKLQDAISLPLPSKLVENEVESPFDHVDEKLRDIQTKTKPWRVLPSTDDIILQSEIDKKKESKTSQLVLCAVLVDKIANLGGLCRTAEIFGVGSLIVGSSRYVEDKGFKSLSVSAERWLNIEQVLPIKLAAYLEEMRGNGYQVVGVEQTANSKTIGEYKFREKTVLLLGNERTGIPVELIQLVDECVEIPQLGIIRSLNVHISGAIMIWEYCKQHMLNISK